MFEKGLPEILWGIAHTSTSHFIWNSELQKLTLRFSNLLDLQQVMWYLYLRYKKYSLSNEPQKVFFSFS